MSQTIEERVKRVVMEQLGVTEDALVPGASFTDDLGADSLDAVEMVMALEEEFSVEITDEESENFVTVNDVITFLNSRL